MPEAWPGGPDKAQIAQWEWEKKTPEQREFELRHSREEEARREAEQREQDARRRDGHERSLRAIKALKAAGGAGLENRRYISRQPGSLFRRARDVDLGPSRLPRAWPVGKVLWEKSPSLECEEFETGITPDCEIVPMGCLRHSEADRLSGRRYDLLIHEARGARAEAEAGNKGHVFIGKVRMPVRTEYGRVEISCSDGDFTAALEGHVSRHLGEAAAAPRTSRSGGGCT